MSDMNLLEKLENMVKEGKNILQDFNWKVYGRAGWEKDKEAESDTVSFCKTYILPDRKNMEEAVCRIYDYLYYLLITEVTITSDDDNSKTIKCVIDLFAKIILGLKMDITVRFIQHTDRITVYYKNSTDMVKTIIARSLRNKLKKIGIHKFKDEDSESDSDKEDSGFAGIVKEECDSQEIGFADIVKKECDSLEISYVLGLRKLFSILWTFHCYLLPFLLNAIIMQYLSDPGDAKATDLLKVSVLSDPVLLDKCRLIMNSCVNEIQVSYVLVEKERVKMEKKIGREKELVKIEKQKIERAEELARLEKQKIERAEEHVIIEMEREEKNRIHRKKGLLSNLFSLFNTYAEKEMDCELQQNEIKL